MVISISEAASQELSHDFSFEARDPWVISEMVHFCLVSSRGLFRDALNVQSGKSGKQAICPGGRSRLWLAGLGVGVLPLAQKLREHT